MMPRIFQAVGKIKYGEVWLPLYGGIEYKQPFLGPSHVVVDQKLIKHRQSGALSSIVDHWLWLYSFVPQK